MYACGMVAVVRPLSLQHAGIKTTLQNMNPKLVAAQYAVRGELVIKAAEYQKALQTKGHGLPFNEVVFCNIGNPQELGQLPISFFRQVLALCVNPSLMQHELAGKFFAADALARARTYMKEISGGTGAYSNSQGVQVVREEVARFIAERDKYPAYVPLSSLHVRQGADHASCGVMVSCCRPDSPHTQYSHSQFY